MRQRLDTALVARGLARSRTAAAAAVAAGRVQVDGAVERRPARAVDGSAVLRVEPGEDRVSRAAAKLEAALRAFALDVRGRSALDLGASTGGFTQVLLAAGAARVVALDVGRGQLVPELRADPRVVVVEGENARFLDAARLAELTGGAARPDVVVADLSFISLALVLPAVAATAAPGADAVVLVKPQFEVGRRHGGIVRDPADRAAAVRRVIASARAAGLGVAGLAPSPITGEHGNREVLLHLHGTPGADPAEWDQSVERVVRADGEAR